MAYRWGSVKGFRAPPVVAFSYGPTKAPPFTSSIAPDK